MRILLSGCAVATVDGAANEYADGHVLVEDETIVAVGPGPAPDGHEADRIVDGAGCLATPGLVNTHHHLYQWATRGLAQQRDLFGWLTELYPVWAGIDADIVVFASATDFPRRSGTLTSRARVATRIAARKKTPNVRLSAAASRRRRPAVHTRCRTGRALGSEGIRHQKCT